MKRLRTLLAVGLGVLALGAPIASAFLTGVTYSGAKQAGATLTLSADCLSTDQQGDSSPGTLVGSWGLGVETTPGSAAFQSYVTAANFAIDGAGHVTASVVIPLDAPTDRALRVGGGECWFSTFGDGATPTAFPFEEFTLQKVDATPTTTATTTTSTTTVPTTTVPTTTVPPPMPTIPADPPSAASPAAPAPVAVPAFVAPAAPVALSPDLPITGPTTPGLPLIAAVLLGLGTLTTLVARRRLSEEEG